MSLFYTIGILILICSSARGWKKGVVQLLGSICAGVLSLFLFWILKKWSFGFFLGTLLFDHSILLVRIILCVVIYFALFFVLKAIFLSLKIVTGLPIIRGLDRILGLILGGVYGVVIVGIMTLLYEWIR